MSTVRKVHPEEYNIVIRNENFREGDVKLFFGDENEEIKWFDSSSNMWSILVNLGFFDSMKQCRHSQGWKDRRDVPPGWSETHVGREKTRLFIFNPKP